jgi:hypothetical protein
MPDDRAWMALMPRRMARGAMMRRTAVYASDSSTAMAER